MNRNNLAYDLSKYEEVSPQKKPEPKIRVRKRRENTGSVPKMIIITVAAGLMLGGVVYSKVENAAIHNEITDQTEYVKMLDSENVRMQSELEEKTAIRSIEGYAETILGMQKLDKSQIEYVSISNGSIADIPEDSDNIFVRIKNSLYDFLEYIRG